MASLAPLSVSAAQSSGAIAQGFPIANDNEIIAGSLVSFKSGSRSVELATADSADRLVGVADENPLLVISDNSKQAQVVLSGTTTALVSDINGRVHAGDKITASPIAGVGMVATSETRIVGTAQDDVDMTKTEMKTINDTDGKSHTVYVGYVAIQVGLAYHQAPAGSNFLPPFVQNLANAIAGKEVSLIRVVICALLLLFSFVGLSILIYGTVRSAMLSLGRNPLAAQSIRKSLYQVGGVAVAALVATLAACYFILVL